ncbi:MAG: hypothetical protein COV45_08235 [Deltaproteobacteria bacterium CG11_big_fil_rev_8_21_14_0_20_47_16]|nr:MAG: hypothetical protein COV45_08235 [Deltaproteobacteria bacterium CG11_big_fil_rev_8_21_14_0_20_47_16]
MFSALAMTKYIIPKFIPWEALFICLILFSTPALAYNIWLLPPQELQVSQSGTALLGEGLRYPTSSKALATNDINSIWLITPDNHRMPLTLGSVKKRATQIDFTPTTPGIYVIAVSSNVETNKSGSTNRSQYAKTLVRVGDNNNGFFGTPVGLDYEIVPMANPFTLRMGDQLPVQVLYKGKPQVNAWVRWQSNKPVPSDQMGLDGITRADNDGKATVPINATGPIMIHVTHMPPKSDGIHQTLRTTLTWFMPARKI